MQEMFKKTFDLIAAYLPNLVGAIAILVIGFLVAFVVAAVVRMVLRRTTLDKQLNQLLFGDEAEKSVPVENIISKGVFYLLLVFVLAAFFQVLQLTSITEPLKNLLDTIVGYYLPSLFGAGILLLIAWMLATVLRRVMLFTLQGAKLDERLASGQADAKTKCAPLSKTLSDVVYWVVFILFLPLILDALHLQGALDPIKTLLNRVFDFVPYILGAGLIILIGCFLARLVRQVVSNFLAAAGLDRLSDRLGLTDTLGEMKLSGLIGLVLYILILIPVIIAGLNALKLDAVTQPASAMLGKILAALPLLFGAALVLVISYIVARIVATLASNVLAGMGFNNVLINLGITKKPAQGAKTPAAIVGMLMLVTIMLMASIEAARMLKFDTLADLLAKLLVFGGHILMGLIILGVGMFLANLVAKSVQESGRPNAPMLSTVARGVILVLAGAMALRQMDIANEIVNLAFGLLLGAVAVAVAIAFGLGGRESAAKLIEEWRASTKGK